MSVLSCSNALEIADYRRRVAHLYAAVRLRGADESSWRRWCETRRRLLLSHSQSPLPAGARTAAGAPEYYDYDPSWQVVGNVVRCDGRESAFPLEGEEGAAFTKVGTVQFERLGVAHSLGLFWLNSYAGGLFLPFRDETNGVTTYGAGRYVLDTAKGADLGAPPEARSEDDALLLDFNFAYHPSCAWDAQWNCPLAPTKNHLPVAVEAGEREPQPERVAS